MGLQFFTPKAGIGAPAFWRVFYFRRESMNRTYQVIWNKTRSCYVVVSEKVGGTPEVRGGLWVWLLSADLSPFLWVRLLLRKMWW